MRLILPSLYQTLPFTHRYLVRASVRQILVSERSRLIQTSQYQTYLVVYIYYILIIAVHALAVDVLVN